MIEEFERSTAEMYGDAARAGVELQLGSHGHLASNPNPGPSPPPLGLPYPPPHTSLGIRVPTAFRSENTQRLRPPWSAPEVPPGESRGAEEAPGTTEPSRRSAALCRPLVGAPAISPARRLAHFVDGRGNHDLLTVQESQHLVVDVRAEEIL